VDANAASQPPLEPSIPAPTTDFAKRLPADWHLSSASTNFPDCTALLDLDTVVAPYEMRLGRPGSVTADTVHAQAADRGLLGAPDVVVLAGRDYSRIVTAVWPHARTPLAGSRSMGEQLQRLAGIAGGGGLDHIGLHQKSA